MVASPTPPSSKALEKVLARLKGVQAARRGWTACCSAHGDRIPSLSIRLGEHGQVLLKCFAGCSIACIVQAMGLTMMDLFPDVDSAADGRKVPSGRPASHQSKHASLGGLCPVTATIHGNVGNPAGDCAVSSATC
jgi:hypothetical protein